MKTTKQSNGTEVQLYSPEEIQKCEGTLNAKQLDTILKRTNPAHIYERRGKGGMQFSYVTGTYMKKILNIVFGWNWDFTVEKFEYNAAQCIVLGKLVVRVGDVSITKQQFGRADIKYLKGKDRVIDNTVDIGNDLKAATTDALKKCASELGIAADVYAPNEFKEIRVDIEADKGLSELDAAKLVLLEKVSLLPETISGTFKTKNMFLDNVKKEEAAGRLTVPRVEGYIDEVTALLKDIEAPIKKKVAAKNKKA